MGLVLAWGLDFVKSKLFPWLLLAIAIGFALWYLDRLYDKGFAAGVNHERQRGLEAQEEESKIVRENRERITQMEPDDRLRLLRCIRERVREGRASPDCERLLQGLHTGTPK